MTVTVGSAVWENQFIAYGGNMNKIGIFCDCIWITLKADHIMCMHPALEQI